MGQHKKMSKTFTELGQVGRRDLAEQAGKCCDEVVQGLWGTRQKACTQGYQDSLWGRHACPGS